MKELTVLEQIILAAVISLKDEAYGMAIRQKVKAMTGKSLMYGTLYNVLDQMHRKTLLRKVKPEGADKAGEHGRVYYALTPEGSRALKAAYKLQKAVWGSLPDLFKE